MFSQKLYSFLKSGRTNRSGFSIIKKYLIFSVLVSFGAASQDSYDLVLAGGALKTCSSFLMDNCEKDTKFNSAKKQDLYVFSKESHARFREAVSVWEKDSEIISKLHSVLEHIYSQGGGRSLTKNAFLNTLNSQGFANEEISGLPDHTYFALLDTHELLQTDSDGARLTEKVSVAGTRNPHSREIYQAFAEQAAMRARGAAPKILVVTASARDPFSVADFYTGIFSDLGAKTTWLPLSGAFQMASSQNQCSALASIRKRFAVFDRERVYPQRTQYQQALCERPEKLLEMIDDADGIFFNGGDQSKTLAALMRPDGTPSAMLAKIHEQVEKGALVVGGTSAGTAVQGGGVSGNLPVPMLTSGEPGNAMSRGIFYLEPPSQRCEENACENGLTPGDITLNPAGGTGLFSHGLIDTHFSERDRETRLIMATLLSGHTLGFGVDETSALLVNDAGNNTVSFKVIGERGVFVADLTRHDWFEQKKGKNLVRQVGGYAHYWPAGTQASINAGGWQVALYGEVPESATPVKNDYNGQWRTEVGYKCGSENRIGWSQFGNQYVLKADGQTRFSKSGKLCGYQSLPFVIRYEGNSVTP